MSETGDIANPAMSQIVNTAIAYADALAARFAGKINRISGGFCYLMP